MPLFYGEGRKNAFPRLQEHIIAQTDDDSIFAWTNVATSTGRDIYRGILAEDPIEFRHGGCLRFNEASNHSNGAWSQRSPH